MSRFHHAITKENSKKMKKEENKKAMPVMKKLARTMSKEELAAVNGAGTMPSNFWGGGPGDIDFQN
jgi:hypothetical protein